MAATKRPGVDSEDVVDAPRPAKKTKTDDTEKKTKKDKKDKKRKTEDGEAPAVDDEAEKKAAKKLRKAEKKAKKEAQRVAEAKDDMDVDPPAEATPKDKKEKKSKKEKKPKTEEPASMSTASKYVQTMSLTGLPQSDIDAFLTTHEISIVDPKGPVTYRPVTEFHHLPATNLLEKKPSPFTGYKNPTPIQAASWPFTLSGRDAVGVAETGSGKTMAFALPCVESLSTMGVRGVGAVIISPTRELAMQTHEQLAKVAALLRLKSVCIYGGASKDEQRETLQRGVDIVVATPGRLKDFMSDGSVDLSRAGFVVLDEADRMLDKGFEEDIKLILGSCPPREKRQTLMFTATWPASVQAIASTFMVSPVKITIGSGGKQNADGGVDLQANMRIKQSVEVMDGRDKEFRLMQLLKERQQGKNKMDRILVFCLYKKEATRVESTLARKGFSVGGIHGDLRQEQRTRSLEAFKSGTTPVLVATDVAARGLDIPEVKLVINVTVCILLCEVAELTV